MCWALGGLFLSAFLSSTILPGNSEAVLLGLLAFAPENWKVLVLMAVLGNVLGAVLTVWLARKLPAPATQGRAAGLALRWGPPSLFLSWVPVAGDVLCAAAGWLRWPWLPVVCWIVAGKTLRYLLLAGIALHWL